LSDEGDKETEQENMIMTNKTRHYLLDIATHVRNYHKNVDNQSEGARKLFQLHGAKQAVQDEQTEQLLEKTNEKYEEKLDASSKKLLQSREQMKDKYAQQTMRFPVRNREIEVDIKTA